MTNPTAARRPWEWRKAQGGWTLPPDYDDEGQLRRVFHAYDINDNAACDRSLRLAASCEAVNEGSHLCPCCMVVVRDREPQGRPKREPVDAD